MPAPTPGVVASAPPVVRRGPAPTPGSVAARVQASMLANQAQQRQLAAQRARHGQQRRTGGLSDVTMAGIRLHTHVIDQARAKGITAKQIEEALVRPYKVTDVTRYPGQKRYLGRGVDGQPGVAVVVDPSTRTAITTYLDGVRTPLREDQLDDPAALNSRRLNGR